MRKPILLLAVALCGGCDAPGKGYLVIDDLNRRSVPIACDTLDPGTVAVDHLAVVSDTSFLVLDAAQLRVTEYDGEGRPLRSFGFQEHGPAAAARPQDVAALGDTAVVIAARGGLRLVVLGWDGSLIRSRSLTFIPNALATTPEGDVLATAIPMGGSPPELLYRFRDGVMDAFPVRGRPYDDMTVGALGNSLLPLGLGQGRALAIHRFFTPRAFGVDLRTGTVESLVMPTPGETRGRIDFVPTPPIRSEHVQQVLVPALDAATNPADGAVYLLTKSGRTMGGVDERILMKLDRNLAYRASWTVDVAAGQLVVLGAHDLAVMADDADLLYLCALRGLSDGS